MAWNNSDSAAAGAAPRADRSGKGGGERGASAALPKGIVRGLAAGVIVAAGAGLALWLLMGRGDGNAAARPEKAKGPGMIAEAKPIMAPSVSTASTNGNARARIVGALNEQVKEFVKVKTNNVSWVFPPMAPDDPDNALRNRITQELDTLLSVEPGEQLPPFPFTFMMEDDEGKGGRKKDGGNALFLEGLKQFKITAKKTDDENALSRKERLVQAQGDLLAGMDEGLSVNDSIRAAYEFRQRAYETRQTIMETLREFVENGDNAKDTVAVLREANEKLAEQGIKQIPPEAIGLEGEDEGAMPE